MNETIYNRVMLANHTLIAGASGSGKSVLINGSLCYAMRNFSNCFEMICIDLKGVELEDYRKTKQCKRYALTVEEAIQALKFASDEMERRFRDMRHRGIRKGNYKILYVIIDELADLMLSAKAKIVPLLQHIGQLGRAVNVKLVCATQCPLVKVIPTEIKVNFDCIVGLRTRSKQDSRNILGIAGCETLPRYGKCLLDIPELMHPGLVEIPNITDAQIQETVKFYGKI